MPENIISLVQFCQADFQINKILQIISANYDFIIFNIFIYLIYIVESVTIDWGSGHPGHDRMAVGPTNN